MRFVKTIGLGLMTALVGSGCNPGDFDSALDKAPVVSFDDGASNGSLFVLPLPAPPPGGTVAARMVVSRKGDASLAVADYDKNGKVTLHQASGDDLANLGNVPINSAASLGPNGPVILGTPSYGANGQDPVPGGVSLLTLTPAAGGSVSLSVQSASHGLDHYGISVAAGRVTGNPASAGEFIVVSDSAVYLLGADAKTEIASTSCLAVHLFDASQGNLGYRPVAVADLFAGGGEEIVLAGLGHVVFLQYNPSTRSLDCLSRTLSQAPMASFGSSLAVADFDGDGQMDLAVGTPPDRIYVYYGPLDKASDPAAIGSAGSSSFGKRISSFPGNPGARLMVADATAASPKGRSGAGKVMLLSVPARGVSVDAATATLSTLFDSSDDSPKGVFGDNLGSLEFDTRTCSATGQVNPVPWASSGTSVLTYFNFPGSVTGDLRCNP